MFTRSLTFGFLALLLCTSASLRAQEWPKENLGTWGGKWDDTWPVFITLTAGDVPGSVTVTYTWVENPQRPMMNREYDALLRDGYLEAGLLVLRVEGDEGMLYGRFARPRMANLVRIPADGKPLSDVSLEEHGWKRGAIPAAEALEKITGSDGAAPKP